MEIAFDYASVDGNKPPDLTEFGRACVAHGSLAHIAIFRGSYGTDPDPTIDRDWGVAQRLGMTCGAYLFLRMNQVPEDQVHVFAQTVGPLTRHDLVPILDVEATGLLAQQEIDQVHRAWMAMRDIYGVPPMIYTSDRVWREDLGSLPAGEMVDSPLWLAKPWPWQTRTPAQLSPGPFANGNYDPAVPASWGGAKNWWMHQYQGDAFPTPGFTSTVDLSRFHPMVQGESGIRVSWVQRRLGWPTNGLFDSSMSSRLRAFQRDAGLVADAIIGPQTFTRVAWQAAPAPGPMLAA